MIMMSPCDAPILTVDSREKWGLSFHFSRRSILQVQTGTGGWQAIRPLLPPSSSSSCPSTYCECGAGRKVCLCPHSRTLARPAPHITCAWPEASPMHPPSMPSAAHHRQPARMLHPHAQLRLCAPQEGRRRPLLAALLSPPPLHGIGRERRPWWLEPPWSPLPPPCRPSGRWDP